MKPRAIWMAGIVVWAVALVNGGGAGEIQFAGRTWLIRDWGQNQEPGPNYWSTNGVWVDSQSNLHLKIYQAGGTNYCAEVVTTNALGYGHYIWYVSNRVDLLDSNVVAGLFTYAPPWGVNEIDIEFTRAFDLSGTNTLVYSIQPYYLPGHQRQFPARLTNGPTTHSFYWIPGYVRWRSWHGWSEAPSNPAAVMAEFTYMGSDVPTTGNERVFMNLWLFEGEDPGTGLTEIVIRDFRFRPVSLGLFSDDFQSSSRDPQWEIAGSDYPGGLVQSNGVLMITPPDVDHVSLGYRTAEPLSLDFARGPYEFDVTLHGADIFRATTQSWSSGEAVSAIFAVLSGSLWDDPWNSSNAVTLRGTFDTNDTLVVELFTKTNSLYSWGTLRFYARLYNVSQYRDSTGLWFRLRLDPTNYSLACFRGSNPVTWGAPWGSATGAHQMGSSLAVSARCIIAAANVADGRGRVLWERASGQLGWSADPVPFDPLSVPGANEVQILDTNVDAVWRHPFDTSQNKARIMCLYLTNDIGRAGLITALAVRTLSAPGIVLSNYVIRMQHTTVTSVPAWTASGWTTVYVADVATVVTGWHYFALSTPFEYDGTRHLLIDFSINNSIREPNSLSYSRRVRRTGARSRYAVAKTGNPLTWTAPAGTVTNDVIALRLSFYATNPPVGPATLKNPDFEDGPAGDDVVPTNWWTYASAAKFSWAGYQGVGNGVAFKNWWSNSYGGFGQDVPVDLQYGDVFLFSIYGCRDSNFVSATSNVWLQLEALSENSTNALVARNIYAEIMSRPPDVWDLYSIGYTNTHTDTIGLRVSVHFSNGRGELPGYRTIKWDKASLVQTNKDPRDNSVFGVPLSWMVQHGLLPEGSTVAEEEIRDPDGDGLATWQEFVAGTNPTNSASRFEILGPAHAENPELVRFSWPSVSGRIYRVDTATSMTGQYQVLSDSILPTPPMNTFTSTWMGSSSRFFRVRVRLP